MKNIWIVYFSLSSIYIFISLSKSELSIWLKFLIIVSIFIMLVLSYLSHLFNKATAFRWIRVFLKELSSNLTPEEFTKIVINCDQISYIRTPDDIGPFIKQLDEYITKSFPRNTRNRIITICNNMAELMEKSCETTSFSVSTYLLSKMEITYLKFISYEAFGDDIKSKTNQNDSYLFLYLFPFLSGVLFAITKNIFFFFLLLILSLFICYIHSKLDHKLWWARFFICFDWVILLICMIFFPRFVNEESFFTIYTFGIIIFSQIVLVIMGLYITNNIWTYAKYELEISKSAIDGKSLNKIISIKFISYLRFFWVWFNFLFIIAGIVAFYTFIYYDQFIMGSFEMCLFGSIDIFFNGNIPSDMYFRNNNITTFIYFYSESVASYIVNILYLANIVRLILEPKVSK